MRPWILRALIPLIAYGIGLAAASSAAAQVLRPQTDPAGQTAPAIVPVAVFGSDDRTDLPRSLNRLRRSIGLLFNNQAHTVCTAFCIADNVVATASHCLFRTSGERRPQLAAFRFALKAMSRTPSSLLDGADVGAVAQNVMAGGLNLRVAPPIDASRDWALVRLKKRLCRGATLPTVAATPEAVGRLAADGKLFQVSFHRDFGDWQLAYATGCGQSESSEPLPTRKSIETDFSSPADLVLHRCDTGGASSGSPLMTLVEGRPTVVAVNVGTYVQTRLMMRDGKVVHRFKSDAIANTAVSARAFAPFVPILSGADILSRATDMRLLQESLRSLGFYSGEIDGSYGPQTRNAIIDFEVARKANATGLATRDLLDSLITERADPATSEVNVRSARPTLDRSGVNLPR